VASNLDVTGSYFFNLTKNSNDQTVNRLYSNNELYHEDDALHSDNYNHRFNFRMEYAIDSSNALIFNPKLNLQSNTADNAVDGWMNQSDSSPISQTSTVTHKTTSGYSTNDAFTFRHKFELPGRTFSLSVNGSGNDKTVHQTVQSRTANYTNALISSLDSTDEQIASTAPGYTLSSNVAYTEPIAATSLLQWNYNYSVQHNRSENNTVLFDTLTQAYSLRDTGLSAQGNDRYTTQQFGFGYRGKFESLTLVANLVYQKASLTVDDIFPTNGELDRSFASFLPMMIVMARPSANTNWRFMLRTSTTPPSISQLQSAVDNSNATIYTQGNPDLQQSTNTALTLRYSHTSPEKASTFFALLSASKVQNYIGTSTQWYAHDTTVEGNVFLKQNVELSHPVNLSGYATVNSFLTYGFPVGFLGSNLNVNTGATYTHTPSSINAILNDANSYTVSQGFVLGSNINTHIDFTLSYTYTWNDVLNTLMPQLNTRYFQHAAELKNTILFDNGLVFRNDIQQQLYNGSGSSYDQHLILWNIGFGKKFFEKQNFELSLNVSDVLNQNSKVTRTVTSSYIEDDRPEVLHRYILFTATYTIRATPL
jgi:hypothetical protein